MEGGGAGPGEPSHKAHRWRSDGEARPPLTRLPQGSHARTYAQNRDSKSVCAGRRVRAKYSAQLSSKLPELQGHSSDIFSTSSTLVN